MRWGSRILVNAATTKGQGTYETIVEGRQPASLILTLVRPQKIPIGPLGTEQFQVGVGPKELPVGRVAEEAPRRGLPQQSHTSRRANAGACQALRQRQA